LPESPSADISALLIVQARHPAGLLFCAPPRRRLDFPDRTPHIIRQQSILKLKVVVQP
jgi:hypothetical protein